jgi:hypothetical protein
MIFALIIALNLGASAYGQGAVTHPMIILTQHQATLARVGSNSSPITDFLLWRKTALWLVNSQITTMVGGTLTHADSGIQEDTKCCYVVNLYPPPCPEIPICGESANSNELRETISAGAVIPAAFFGVNIFGTPTCPHQICDPSTSYPLEGGIVLGTLGKIGFTSGYHIEPTCDGGTNQNSSCYNWTGLDIWVNFAVSKGYTLVYDWTAPPGWQCGLSSTESCTSLPANLTYMSNFATALATRYAGKIKYYETGNEVNLPNVWRDTCANLVLLHNTIYNAIKAADPNAIVGAPNMAYSNVSTACSNSPTRGGVGHEWIWLQNFLQTRDRNGNLPKVDTAGEHEYQIVQPALHNVAQRFLNVYNSFRSVMTAAGISPSQPLLVTEGGFGPTINNSCSAPLNTTACLTREGQAAYVSRFLVLAASTWSDGGGELPSWYAYDINWGTLNGKFGMNSQNASAYGQMEQWLTNATFSHQCHTGSPSTVFVCDFIDASHNQAEIIFNDNSGSKAMYTTPGWATHYQWLLGKKTAIRGGIVTVGDTPILLTP